ncbi:HNH/ENDO VII family nuclease [Anaerosporobacter sp.]
MKWLSKGSKWATKASKYVDTTCNIIAGTSTLYRSSDSAYKRVEYLYDNYIKTGKKFDGRAAREVLGLALDITSSVLSGKQIKSGIGGFCKQAKEDRQLRKALDGYSVADGKKPYALLEQYGIPSTLDKSSREVLDAGGYQMKASEGGKGSNTGREYWRNSVESDGNKVYQRDDLFDTNTKSSWKQKGKTVIGTNVERMAAGNAPIGYDGKPINLHHVTQSQKGAIAEVSQSFHQKYYSVIHSNTGQLPSGINRSEINSWKRNYWINRALDFQ